MQPRTLDEYIGQEHIVGKSKLLRRAIEADLRVKIEETLERRRLHNERTILFVKQVLETLHFPNSIYKDIFTHLEQRY